MERGTDGSKNLMVKRHSLAVTSKDFATCLNLNHLLKSEGKDT